MEGLLKLTQGKLEVPCSACHTTNAIPVAKLLEGPVCGSCKAKLGLPGSPVEVTDESFAQLVKDSPVPVLIDFWAPWCGPCRMMGPVLDKVAKAKAGAVLIAKLNTQENQGVPGSLGIQAIPTLIVFKEGREVARHTGAIPEPAVLKLLG